MDKPARFEIESFMQVIVNAAGYLNAAWDAGRFHTTGEIHRVTPEIVDKLAGADDTSHHRPRVYSDTQLEIESQLFRVLACNVHHLQRHARHSRGMVWAWARQTANRHVAVANGFDLFDSQFLGQLIKPAEQAIEHLHDIDSGRLAGERCEPHNGPKQHSHIRKSIRYLMLAALQARCDLAGKDIQQE